jgi:hypothetical protein
MPSEGADLKTAPVLSEQALSWGYRSVWLLCVAVYLTVFVGSVQAGGSDLVSMARAVGFTIATAVIGRLALAVLAHASQPVAQEPMATEEGKVGSLVDLTSSTNVTPLDEAEAA